MFPGAFRRLWQPRICLAAVSYTLLSVSEERCYERAVKVWIPGGVGGGHCHTVIHVIKYLFDVSEEDPLNVQRSGDHHTLFLSRPLKSP